MLRPFLIRDLHEDSQLHDIIEDTASDLYNATDVSVGPQRRHGLVRLAAADYDEIAHTHPQARLTYLDEDDGDIITIGSSLELAQRLDEPPSQTTDTFPATIHLFDIRRRQSIIDIWKKFEYNEHATVPELASTDVGTQNLDEPATAPQAQINTEQIPQVQQEHASTAADDTSESFLSAFETEMAKIMNEPRHPESSLEGEPSFRAAQVDSTPNLTRETAEAFASALRSLMEVAESISSGVKAKIPELERHLDNARRSLPSDITDSMRNAFLAFEAQVRAMATTINNIPDTIRRESGPGNSGLFSELPLPNGVFNGLREMSVQLGGLGQTLLETIYESSRGTFPGQGYNHFFNFPNFPEANNSSTTVPSSAEGPAISQHDTNPAPAAGSDNMPSVVPTSNTNPHESQGFSARPESTPGPQPDFAFPRSGTQTYANHRDMYGGPWQRPYISHYPLPPWLPQFPFFHPPVPAPINAGVEASPQPQSSSSEPLPSTAEPNSSRSLFIGNIGFNVTEKMVKDVFKSKGLEAEVNLPQDSRTIKHAGFGYLTFRSGVEAAQAMRALQGVVIDGHCINLEYIDHAPITSLNRDPEELSPATVHGPSPQTSGVVRHEAAPNVPDPEDAGPKSNNESVHDLLMAQAEARFPPVSQLDAHIVAGQSSLEPQSSSSQTRGEANAGDVWQTPRAQGGQSQLPGSFPHEAHDDPSEPHHGPRRRATERHFSRDGRHTGPSGHRHPHRATTTRVPRDRRSFDPFEPQPGLRRRATERHSLRDGPHMGPRHRASFHHLSQPTPEQTQSAASLNTHEEEPAFEPRRIQAKQQQKQRAINECVSRLAEMGFGNEEDGGAQRLSVYAAAAKGDLFEAIGMIEEEREAYKQRG